jgi:hypothetical protein
MTGIWLNAVAKCSLIVDLGGHDEPYAISFISVRILPPSLIEKSKTTAVNS